MSKVEFLLDVDYDGRPKQEASLPRPVYRIDVDGKAVMYKSMRQASKDTGISLSNIHSCAHGYTGTAGGYSWKFADCD